MAESNQKTWRIIDLINWGEEYFKSKNITNARLEIEWFLCHIMNCKRINLYLQFEQPLYGVELKTFKSYVLRRVKREPFQHIIGAAPFYGRDFIVAPDVLIPRPETETIISILKSRDPVESMLEIGTGSGCLSITCALEKCAQTIIATDVHKPALVIARKNAEKFNINSISFRRHDFLTDPIATQFDVVISNPPYISKSEIENLQPEVKNYDPISALTDNGDGLTFYRKFAATGKSLLKKNGIMLLEIGGEYQVEQIRTIFQKVEFEVTFHDDLQKKPRVVEVNLQKC